MDLYLVVFFRPNNLSMVSDIFVYVNNGSSYMYLVSMVVLRTRIIQGRQQWGSSPRLWGLAGTGECQSNEFEINHGSRM